MAAGSGKPGRWTSWFDSKLKNAMRKEGKLEDLRSLGITERGARSLGEVTFLKKKKTWEKKTKQSGKRVAAASEGEVRALRGVGVGKYAALTNGVFTGSRKVSRL